MLSWGKCGSTPLLLSALSYRHCSSYLLLLLLSLTLYLLTHFSSDRQNSLAAYSSPKSREGSSQGKAHQLLSQHLPQWGWRGHWMRVPRALGCTSVAAGKRVSESTTLMPWLLVPHSPSWMYLAIIQHRELSHARHKPSGWLHEATSGKILACLPTPQLNGHMTENPDVIQADVKSLPSKQVLHQIHENCASWAGLVFLPPTSSLFSSPM